MLPRVNRLRRRTEIHMVRRRGRRRSHRLLLLFADEKTHGTTRFAVSVGARIGNAVVRNRLKRRIREAIRRQLPDVQDGWDCLFVAREAIVEAPFSEIEVAVQSLLIRSGILGRRITD
jgi:ribonuclease P protein component